MSSTEPQRDHVRTSRSRLLAPFLAEPALQCGHMLVDWDDALVCPVVYGIGSAMWRAGLPLQMSRVDERVASYQGEDLDWCLRAWAAPSVELTHGE